MPRTALVAGPTGLIGRNLVDLLLQTADYGELRALSRRALAQADPRLQVLPARYDALASLGPALAVDDVYCCLGTTRRQAGSAAAFEAVDYGMVVALAQATHAAGARRFVVVSSVGASPRALSLYARVKGRMEQAVAAQGFEAVQIVRPSLLLGARADRRPAEDLAQRLSPLVMPLLRGRSARYRPVPAGEVAAALRHLALHGAPGVHVHHLPLEGSDSAAR